MRRFLLLAVAIAAVMTTASPAGALPANYVALGDSYTAGPIIPLYEQPYGCLRSTNNYPHLVAPVIGLPLRDVSCSGAETGDMTSAQGVTPGPNPPQFDALDAGTTVVTLQIGGNDIGFSSLAESCFSPVPQGTPCQDANVVNGQDQVSQRIAEAAPKVAAAVAGIHTRAPNARVFVLGYPAIVPDTDALTETATCWPQLPISPQDIPWVRAKEKELNAMVANAAAQNGATYIDLYAASIGHDACKAPVIRWVEPAVPAGPAAPVHPNLVGMRAFAKVVEAAIKA